jgi:integrase
MKDAFVVAKRLGVTTKSRARDRRPTMDELDSLMMHFGERLKRRPSSVPMQKIMAFAIFSTRRLEEITRICWIDLDAEKSGVDPGHENSWREDWKRCLVRPPAGGAPNHRLHAEGLRGDFSLQHGCDRGRLHASVPISRNYGLTFHDLRHDGVSRLFETGLSIPQVGSVSGHRAWSSLKRYTHLRQTGDKYADWKWLSVVIGANRG